MSDRLIVVWRLTEACNLACGFCRYDKRLGFARKRAERERVLAIGEELAGHQRRTRAPIHVSFLGGEPLLWPAFCEVARTFRHRYELGTGVTTNGRLLTSKRIFACVLEAIDELTISVDGLGPFHDRVRGWPGGFSQLRALVSELVRQKQLRGRGPLLRANVVLMRDNIDSFAVLCRELCSFGIEELTFNQLGGRDRPEFFAAHRLLPEQISRFRSELPTVRAELAAAGLVLRGGERYLERISASAGNRRLPISDCAPGEQFLYLTEAGTASPCSFTADAIGVALADNCVAELPARFNAARASHAHPACADCPSTQVFGKFAHG